MSKLIDGSQSDFQRWELPHMGEKRPRKEEVEEEVKPLTAEQIEAIQNQAYKEGFAQGRSEGLEAGQKEIDAQAKRLGQIMQSLAKPLEAVDEQVEQELVALSMAVARQLIRREIEQDPEQVIAVVREAMGELPSAARNVRIHLHPDDAALVREAFSTEQADTAPWQVVEDVTQTRGGCRIESDTSRIDATVEKRLNAIIVELMGGSRVADNPQ
ncbi:MAG: flagellar assembly protein FliH [Pseudomonadota bacterium]